MCMHFLITIFVATTVVWGVFLEEGVGDIYESILSLAEDKEIEDEGCEDG